MNLVCVRDFEQYAKSILSENVLGYYNGGAGLETTLTNNQSAFFKFRFRPRCLIDVQNRNLSTTILGQNVSFPVGIAPTAMQRMAHPEGEVANVRAAESRNTIFILSSYANSSMEEIAESAPHAIKWFQMSIYKDRELTKSLIRRAEAAGFKALVLTVDMPVFGIRYPVMRNSIPSPPHLKLSNFVDFEDGKYGAMTTSNMLDLLNPSFNWNDVEWFMNYAKLPIILKGILSREDAKIACDLGVAGIIVSNHGGRQLDGVPASIEVLPEIVKEVKASNKNIEVYMDSGIRDGSDVFKAIALGAKMVFIGRPAIWGLVQNGQKGVERVLDIIKQELDVAMAMCGCVSLQTIDRNKIIYQADLCKL